MKKILFLLLCTVSMYGQVSTGQEQEFDYGIKNNSTQTVTTPTYLGTVGADGTYGKILLSDLQGKKAFLSTGLIKNGLISANGDPTKFNITAGIGIISNFDDPENPTSTIVNFPAFTGITPTYLLTGTITYVAINDVATVVMQATPFTPEQRRSFIVLGAVVHSNLTTINVINNISAPTNASTNQLHDFIEAVGALNLTGNKYTANGANLQLNKSAGLIFKLGSNFANDWKNPHELAQTAGTSLTFRYRTQNGTEGSDRINLDPALYDLNNVLTAVPNNKFTIQTVTMFQSGVTRIQYGQNVYDDLATAKNAVFTRNFVLEPNSKENGIIRAYIIMKNTTTSLQNVADADILEAQKFGGIASGGVALTLANIVSALGYTPENVANKSDSFTDSSSSTYSSTKALFYGLATKQNTLTNPITGTGTANYLPKFTGASTLVNSLIYDNGTSVGIGTTIPNFSSGGRTLIDINGSSQSMLAFSVGGVGKGFLFHTNTDLLISNEGNGSVKFNTNGSQKLEITSAGNANFSSSVTATNFNGSATLTGTPTAPTATLGTNTTQIATTAFVQAIRPYKVYTALLTQTGTSAPTATVLENTLGATIVWTRSNVGIYVGTLSGVFTANKTYTSNTFGSFSGFAQFSSSSVNTVNINSTNSSGSLTDGLINGNSIEIRVYN